jgi:alkanesulfonate monooxygenase SsuD/methylene tetrahydromethanopterin reductase-like flavin-dependent oxidoreductase (luciferase family)
MEPRYNDLVPDRWVDRFSLAGSPGRVLERCRRAAVDGADQVAIVFAGPDPEEQMRTFAAAVIAPMRLSTPER